MRALSIITLLAALVLPSGHAPASPTIDISAADLQALQIQAAQGFAPAQNNLRVLYDNGRGVPVDYTKGREWFEKAAAQGDAGAQYNLRGFYEFGHGVTQDYVRAYMWYNVAATSSTNDAPKDIAAENRDEIAGRMTPAQIAAGQRLANRCQAQQFKGC